MPLDSEIIDAFDNTPYETVLPQEEPFAIFYDKLEDTSMSFFLNGGDSYGLFYFDEEITINTVLEEETDLNVFSDEKKTVLHIVYRGKNDEFDIYFPFKHTEDAHMSFLAELKEMKTFRVHYLMSLYGGIFKAASKEYTLSEELLEQLP